MRAVWKYDIPIYSTTKTVEIPIGARFLHSAIQYSDTQISVWLEVDPANQRVPHRFHLFGTGHPIEDRQLNYLGTTLHSQGRLVLHLYADWQP